MSHKVRKRERERERQLIWIEYHSGYRVEAFLFASAAKRQSYTMKQSAVSQTEPWWSVNDSRAALHCFTLTFSLLHLHFIAPLPGSCSILLLLVETSSSNNVHKVRNSPVLHSFSTFPLKSWSNTWSCKHVRSLQLAASWHEHKGAPFQSCGLKKWNLAAHQWRPNNKQWVCAITGAPRWVCRATSSRRLEVVEHKQAWFAMKTVQIKRAKYSLSGPFSGERAAHQWHSFKSV